MQEYPQINYTVVLAYVPDKKTEHEITMRPEGIGSVHPHYAIYWRNNWLLNLIMLLLTLPTPGAAQHNA